MILWLHNAALMEAVSPAPAPRERYSLFKPWQVESLLFAARQEKLPKKMTVNKKRIFFIANALPLLKDWEKQ
jgi:hypothetical protein